MPLLLTQLRTDGSVDVLIVLDRDSLERIKEYDPFELRWKDMPEEFRQCPLGTVGVTYGTKNEIAQAQQMGMQGRSSEAIQLLTRGFKFAPGRGDHDFGPVQLGKPTPGVKQ